MEPVKKCAVNGWRVRRQGRRRASKTLLVPALSVVLCLLAALASSCGGEAPPTGNEVTAEFTRVLGHAPSGIALEVAEKGTMVVVNDAGYAPFSSLNENGDMVGFDVDVAVAAANVLGVKLRQKQWAWDTIPAALEAGRFDVSIGSMTATASRKESLGFTSPYFWTIEHLAIRRGTPFIDGPEGMRGKTIGCSKQSTALDYLRKVDGVEIRAFVSEADGLVDLERGRIDGYVSSLNFLMEAISAGQPFELSGSPLYYTAASFAYRKGEDDWAALLEYAVRTLRTDGTLAAASKRWFWGFDLTKAPPAGVAIEGDTQ